MSGRAALDALLAHQRVTEALAAVEGRTGWDQETVMPRGAAAQRSEEMAALSDVLHARRSDRRVGDWLAALPADLTLAEAAQRREIARAHARATRVPADLAGALARVTSLSQGEWAAARAADDFAAFSKRLTEVVGLKRQEAAALAEGTGRSLYDALLDDYEPGATADGLSQMFERLRPRLVALREAIAGSDRKPLPLKGTFDPAKQMKLAREVALAFGYDLDRGRIDMAAHPFSSGSGADVRITTRTDPADPFNCVYSTIHEVGHATYEQNVEPSLTLSAIGRGASMGVHESQSRLYENQLGRSRAFTGWLYGKICAKFGDFGIDNAEDFYRTVNRVETGFIRTEADEVHYNLHVMLRFDLEKDVISGALEVADLEEAWNARFARDFGRAVPSASKGVLQDIHWSLGLVGYFPTYTLGNVYAGNLFKILRDDVPALDAELTTGRPQGALDWLRDRVQRHGALMPPDALMRQATGGAPGPEALLDYLEAKFGDLYDL
jgi:carboxypeptidase Taq